MLHDDASYYRRRAEVETELAAKAACPKAVSAHCQLATMYFDRVESRRQPKFLSCD